MAIGTIAATDFSLLGIGFPRKEAPEVLKKTDLWTMLGLILIIFSGILIFMTDADDYVVNRAFQVKMAFLVLAIIFNYTIQCARWRSVPTARRSVVKTVAGISPFSVDRSRFRGIVHCLPVESVYVTSFVCAMACP